MFVMRLMLVGALLLGCDDDAGPSPAVDAGTATCLVESLGGLRAPAALLELGGQLTLVAASDDGSTRVRPVGDEGVTEAAVGAQSAATIADGALWILSEAGGRRVDVGGAVSDFPLPAPGFSPRALIGTADGFVAAGSLGGQPTLIGLDADGALTWTGRVQMDAEGTMRQLLQGPDGLYAFGHARFPDDPIERRTLILRLQPDGTVNATVAHDGGNPVLEALVLTDGQVAALGATPDGPASVPVDAEGALGDPRLRPAPMLADPVITVLEDDVIGGTACPSDDRCVAWIGGASGNSLDWHHVANVGPFARPLALHVSATRIVALIGGRDAVDGPGQSLWILHLDREGGCASE